MTEIRVSSAGQVRPVTVHFAKSYDGRKALPLVLDLHASGSNGPGQAATSGLQAAADRHGFVVAWPEGSVELPGSPVGRFWNIPGVPLVNGAATPASARDDIRFIDDVITHLLANACVDARRVFVTGMSGGARMSSQVGCRLAARLAGIAPVGGVRAGKPQTGDLAELDPESCQPARPISVIAFHGSDDAVNPYGGGGGPHWGYSVPQAMSRWGAIDGCEVKPAQSRIAPDVAHTVYKGCRGASAVELYLIQASREAGGGHTWPGSAAPVPAGLSAIGAPSATLNATEIMSRFFVTHSAPP